MADYFTKDFINVVFIIFLIGQFYENFTDWILRATKSKSSDFFSITPKKPAINDPSYKATKANC